MHDTELTNIMTIEDARRSVQALLRTNGQLVNEIGRLKVSLEIERKKARTWRLIAITAIITAVVGWGLWITT